MNRRWLIGLALLGGLAAGLQAAQEEHPVNVTVHPAKVTRHTFDPKRPPAAMPKLTPPESGVCHFEFTSDAGLGTLVDELSPGVVEVEVDSVDIILDLPIDIWVMIGAPAKLQQHEEGHRQICEDYYAKAAPIAQRLGKAMIGRKATGRGRTKAEATKAATQQLLTELNDALMRELRVPCRICQDHYDDITTHGLKPIAEADAIAQAKVLQASGKLPSTGAPEVNPVRTPGR